MLRKIIERYEDDNDIIKKVFKNRSNINRIYCYLSLTDFTSSKEDLISDSEQISFFLKNRRYKQTDIQNEIKTISGKRLVLYSWFYRVGQVTDKKREIICYHYTEECNVKGIIRKGIISKIGVVFCTISDGSSYWHYFPDGKKKINTSNFWCKNYGEARIKIKCDLDDIEFWAGGLFARSFEIRFKKIDSCKIVGSDILR